MEKYIFRYLDWMFRDGGITFYSKSSLTIYYFRFFGSVDRHDMYIDLTLDGKYHKSGISKWIIDDLNNFIPGYYFAMKEIVNKWGMEQIVNYHNNIWRL